MTGVMVVAMLRRAPGMDAEAFREYYENSHAPLIAIELPYFRAYRRMYVSHDPHRVAHRAGAQRPDVDVVVTMEFATRADYERLVHALADPVIGSRIAADEEQFLDRAASRSMVIDAWSDTAPASFA